MCLELTCIKFKLFLMLYCSLLLGCFSFVDKSDKLSNDDITVIIFLSNVNTTAANLSKLKDFLNSTFFFKKKNHH